jgi:plastocyanin
MQFVLLFVVLAAAAAACGSGSSSATPAPTQAVTVKIVAGDRLFDLETIRVPANSRVTIELENLDADPHNIAIYNSPAAEQEIFVSDTIAGRGTKTSGAFDAPPPGDYFFRCDVHPVTMTGDLIVEQR